MTDPAAPWPPPPPAQAFECPKCRRPARPAPDVQRCACGLAFSMRAGQFLDRSVAPPADPKAKKIVTKSGGTLVRRYGGIDAEGVFEGALDPILGAVPMTANRIGYRGVYTVTVWRRVSKLEALLVLLIPVPFTLAVAAGIPRAPELGLLFVPMVAITLWALAGAFLVRAHFVRVVGAKQTLSFRFDRPFWRRRRFHDELLRRCGLSPGPIP